MADLSKYFTDPEAPASANIGKFFDAPVAPTPVAPVAPDPGAMDYARLGFRGLVKEAPLQAAATVAGMIEGPEGVEPANPDIGDRIRGYARRSGEEFAADVRTTLGEGFVPEMVQAIPSLGYSAATMPVTAAASAAGAIGGAALGAAAGLPTGPGALTTAGAGAVGGATAGLAAGYLAMDRAAQAQILGDLAAQEERKMGRPFTEPEFAAFKADLDAKVAAYGGWEAGPEALSNVIDLAILRKVPGASAITKAGKKLLGIAATELPTETITQIGQSQALEGTSQARPDGPLSFTSPGDIATAGREVLPGVLVVGGGMTIANAALEAATARSKGETPETRERALEVLKFKTENPGVEIPDEVIAGFVSGQPLTGEAPLTQGDPIDAVSEMRSPGTETRQEVQDPELRVQSPEVAPAGERRANLTRRERLAQLSPEELEQEVYRAPRTGLPNKRAFEENPRLPVVASLDLDGLKWVNDNMNHQSGDELIRAIGTAIAELTPEGYDVGGDEFIIQGETPEAVQQVIDKIKDQLSKAVIEYTAPNGDITRKTGVEFGYGIGTDIASAEEGLKLAKAKTRGAEPAGVVRIPAARGDAASAPAQEEVAATPTTKEARIRAERRAKKESVKSLTVPAEQATLPETLQGGAMKPASWVVKNKETGEVVTELFGQGAVDKLNTDKYEAVPIQEHLASLGPQMKNEPSPPRVYSVPDAAPSGEALAEAKAPAETQVEPAAPAPSASPSGSLPRLKRGYKRSTFTVTKPDLAGNVFVEDVSPKGVKTLSVRRPDGSIQPATKFIADMVSTQERQPYAGPAFSEGELDVISISEGVDDTNDNRDGGDGRAGNLLVGGERLGRLPGDQSLGERQGAVQGSNRQGAADTDRRAARSVARKDAGPIEVLTAVIAKETGKPLPQGTFTQVAPPKGQEALFAALASVLKKEIVFFKGKDAPMTFNGVTGISEGIIYVNIDATKPHLVIAGHEFLHDLKKDDPESYAALRDVIMEVIPEKTRMKMWQGLNLKRQKEGRQPLALTAVDEELIADFFGEQFTSKEFWAKVERRNPEGFAGLVQKLLAFLDRIKTALTGEAREDIQRAQDAAAAALARYVEKNPEAQYELSLSGERKFSEPLSPKALAKLLSDLGLPSDLPLPNDFSVPEGFDLIADDNIRRATLLAASKAFVMKKADPKAAKEAKDAADQYAQRQAGIAAANARRAVEPSRVTIPGESGPSPGEVRRVADNPRQLGSFGLAVRATADALSGTKSVEDFKALLLREKAAERTAEVNALIAALRELGHTISSPETFRAAVEAQLQAEDSVRFSESVMTDSPAFKAWFGDSKVVDEQGRPLVVYHGTTSAGFSEFSPKFNKKEQVGFGVSFTSDKDFAGRYATGEEARKGKNRAIYPVYLAIKNPLLGNEIVTEGTPEYDLAKKLGGSRVYNALNPDLGKRQIFMQAAVDATSPERAQRLIEEAGYDGVMYEAKIYGLGAPGRMSTEAKAPTYVAFSPTQIKSVFNRGTFDPNNPDIRFSESTFTSTAKTNLKALKDSLLSGAVATQNLVKLLKVTPEPVVAEVWGDDMPQVKTLYSARRQRDAVRNDLINEFGLQYKTLVQDKATRAAVNKVAETASFHQMWPDRTAEEQDWFPKNDSPLGERYVQAQAAWVAAGMQSATGKTFREAYKESAQAYQALKPEVQQNYLMAVELMQQLRLREKDGVQRIIEEYTQDNPALREEQLAALNQSFASLKGAYWPFYREGDFVLSYMDAGQRHVEHFKSVFEREMAAQALVQGGVDAATIRLDTKDKMPKALALVPSGYNAQLGQAVEAAYIEDRLKGVDPADQAAVEEATAQAKQDAAETVRTMTEIWLKWQPETSALKNHIRRKNVLGWSSDMLRGFLEYGQTHATKVAQLEQGRKIETLLNDIANDLKGRTGDTTRQRIVLNDLRDREAASKTATTSVVAQKLGKLTTFYYMTSPSIALVQMTQLGVLTLPKLATMPGIGMAKATNALRKGVQAAFSPKYTRKVMFGDEQVNSVFQDMQAVVTTETRTDFPGKYDDVPLGTPLFSREELTTSIAALSSYQKKLLALHVAMSRGLLDISLSHEVGDIVRDEDPESVPNKVFTGMMVFMRESEKASRKAAILAAFDASGGETDFFKGMQAVEEVVESTLYNYSKDAKGVLLQGGVARVLTTFQTFRIMTAFKLGLLFKQSFAAATPEVKTAARKELVGIFAMSGLVAGALGMPFAPILFKVLDAVLGDDDEPFDSEAEFRQWVAENFGEAASGVAMDGPPSLLGASLSRRIGLGDVVGSQSELPARLHGEGALGWYATQALGPSYSVVSGWARGYDQMVNEGETMKGLIAATPKPLADMLKAYGYATDGLKTGLGKRLMTAEEVDANEVLLQGLGFAPFEISRMRGDQAALDQLSTRISQRRGQLMQDFVRAYMEDGDTEEQMEAIREYNAKAPALAIGGGELRGALRIYLKRDAGIDTRREMLLKR